MVFTLDQGGTLVARGSDGRSYACGVVPALTGPAGTSVKYLYLDAVHNLHVVYSDGRTSNLGYIRGPPGPATPGPPGPSIEHVSLDNLGHLVVRDTVGNIVMTEQTLFGHTGPRGPQGVPGSCSMTGCTGPKGPGFTDGYVNDQGELMLVLDTGAVVHAGCVCGPTGVGVVSARVQDNRLQLLLSDGSKLDAGSVQGPKGTGVARCELTPTGTLLMFYTDGRVERCGSLENFCTGPTGPCLTGPPGVGIASIQVGHDGTLSVNYTNQTQQLAGRISGPPGPQGPRGPPGPPGKPLGIETAILAYEECPRTHAMPAVQNLLGRYPLNKLMQNGSAAALDSETHTFSLEKGTYRLDFSLQFISDTGSVQPAVFVGVRDAHTRELLTHANMSKFTGVICSEGCEQILEVVYFVETAGALISTSLGGPPCGHAVQGSSEVYGTVAVTKIDYC